jgi:hypothetical protein
MFDWILNIEARRNAEAYRAQQQHDRQNALREREVRALEQIAAALKATPKPNAGENR